MCKSREQLLSPGEQHTAPAFPFTCYHHNYTTAHGNHEKRDRQEESIVKKEYFFIRLTWLLEAFQRQAERGIRYFTFKEQTLLNKAEKEGECRYLTKLDTNVLIYKGQCYDINVKDHFTIVGCDHVERGHWWLITAHGATCWTKQDRFQLWPCWNHCKEENTVQPCISPLGTSKPLQAKKGDILSIPYWRNTLRDFTFHQCNSPSNWYQKPLLTSIKKPFGKLSSRKPDSLLCVLRGFKSQNFLSTSF